MTDLARLCEGDERFEDTAQYRGEGPHRLVLQKVDNKDDSDYVYVDEQLEYVYVGGALKAEKRHFPPPGKVELVGCFHDIGRGRELQRCPYGGHSVVYYQGRYRVDVYTARTGLPVATLRVDGKTDPGRCPGSWMWNEGEKRTPLMTGVDKQAFAARLAPLVEKPARD